MQNKLIQKAKSWIVFTKKNLEEPKKSNFQSKKSTLD